MPETTLLQIVEEIEKDNKRIAKKIRSYFVDLFAAHKLQMEIQKMEDSMKTLELKVGGIELFAMFAFGRNHPGFISDMKEQLSDEYESLALLGKSIVEELDYNTQQLEHIRAELESDTPELIAVNAVIKKLGAFAWAFKDSRADMMDLFAVPDVLQIYIEALEKAAAK